MTQSIEFRNYPMFDKTCVKAIVSLYAMMSRLLDLHRYIVTKFSLKHRFSRQSLMLFSICIFVVLFILSWIFINYNDDPEQLKRIGRIRQVCKRYRHLMKREEYRKHVTVFYSSGKHRISYCKIGKIASTFWTQFFYILHHDVKSAESILDLGREKVHILENEGHIHFGVNLKTRAGRGAVVVSSRNPYTRLYSAYIDRIYIPSTSQSIRRDDKCKSLITFEEFLQYVVKNTRNGLYDYHWSPVFYICKPCEVNPNVLFKQETFRADIAHIVKKSGMDNQQVEVVNDIMKKSGNWSGYALIEDILEYVVPKNIFGPLYCQTWKDITYRIWQALKIQGYIDVQAPFPTELYKTLSDYENPNLFRKGLKIARDMYPMNRAKKDEQRREALYSAYRNIDPEVIAGIQDVFQVDFEMFGYTSEPPPWNSEEV